MPLEIAIRAWKCPARTEVRQIIYGEPLHDYSSDFQYTSTAIAGLSKASHEGSKKQSKEQAALFAVRVHVIISQMFYSFSN